MLVRVAQLFSKLLTVMRPSSPHLLRSSPIPGRTLFSHSAISQIRRGTTRNWSSSILAKHGSTEGRNQAGREASPHEHKKNEEEQSQQIAQEDLEKREESKSVGQNKKTVAEIDAEIRNKMEGRSGDGGEAGIELENGQPVAMKRSVKNNMFRYI